MKRLLLFLILSINIYSNSILIISSYPEKLAWTNSFITRIIANYHIDYHIDIVVFNETSQDFNKEYRRVDKEVRELEAQRDYELIVVLDEDAYIYVEGRSEEFHEKYFVIAAGILPTIPRINSDYVIYEGIDFNYTINMIDDLLPNLKGIILLSDNSSPKNKYLIDQFHNEEKNYPHLDLISYNKLDQINLEHFLSNTDKDYAIIQGYTPNINQGKFNEVFYWSSMEKWSRNPVFVPWSTFLNYSSVVGGNVIDIDTLSKRLASIIEEFLFHGYLLGQSEVVPAVNIFDFSSFQKFGIRISHLPKNSDLIHQNIYDFTKYKRQNLLLIVFIIVLITVIAIMWLLLRGNTKLYKELKKNQVKLQKKDKESIESYRKFSLKLASIAEAYDETTGRHIYRVGALSQFIAEKMKLNDDLIRDIAYYAPLHDIGKIFVPNEILNKRGALDKDEWTTMQGHTELAERLLGDDIRFSVALNIALYHHEKYDGSGYPNKLSGNNIPIEACIVAITDVYDALRSKRPYKDGFTHNEALKILKEGDKRTKPHHFHPKVLDIFISHNLEIDKLWESINKE